MSAATRAPLLLIPVKLERRSVISRFTLRFQEDEPRFNATLLQFIEREFDLKMPQFSGELSHAVGESTKARLSGLTAAR